MCPSSTAVLAPSLILSADIGRNITFTPDEVDQIPPIVVPDLEFDQPMYRSSALHWGSKLMLVGGRLMSSIYVLKPGISLAVRQAAVPELHLALESWRVAFRSGNEVEIDFDAGITIFRVI